MTLSLLNKSYDPDKALYRGIFKRNPAFITDDDMNITFDILEKKIHSLYSFAGIVNLSREKFFTISSASFSAGSVEIECVAATGTLYAIYRGVKIEFTLSDTTLVVGSVINTGLDESNQRVGIYLRFPITQLISSAKLNTNYQLYRNAVPTSVDDDVASVVERETGPPIVDTVLEANDYVVVGDPTIIAAVDSAALPEDQDQYCYVRVATARPDDGAATVSITWHTESEFAQDLFDDYVGSASTTVDKILTFDDYVFQILKYVKKLEEDHDLVIAQTYMPLAGGRFVGGVDLDQIAGTYVNIDVTTVSCGGSSVTDIITDGPGGIQPNQVASISGEDAVNRIFCDATATANQFNAAVYLGRQSAVRFTSSLTGGQTLLIHKIFASPVSFTSGDFRKTRIVINTVGYANGGSDISIVLSARLSYMGRTSGTVVCNAITGANNKDVVIEGYFTDTQTFAITNINGHLDYHKTYADENFVGKITSWVTPTEGTDGDNSLTSPVQVAIHPNTEELIFRGSMKISSTGGGGDAHMLTLLNGYRPTASIIVTIPATSVGSGTYEVAHVRILNSGLVELITQKNTSYTYWFNSLRIPLNH